MSEQEKSMHPDLTAALRNYEVEVRDGTERSQKLAFETLRLIQRRLGIAATSAAGQNLDQSGPEEQQQVAS